jgi:hypothetical protein
MVREVAAAAAGLLSYSRSRHDYGSRASFLVSSIYSLPGQASVLPSRK